jgi:hypothetical protein
MIVYMNHGHLETPIPSDRLLQCLWVVFVFHGQFDRTLWYKDSQNRTLAAQH